MLELTPENFDKEVSQGIVVVDFWADGCAPCKDLMPLFTAFSEGNNTVKCVKFNTSGQRRFAMGHGVMGVPTLAVYVDGEQKTSFAGSQATITNLEDFLKSL